jgi:hypothetical protein
VIRSSRCAVDFGEIVQAVFESGSAEKARDLGLRKQILGVVSIDLLSVYATEKLNSLLGSKSQLNRRWSSFELFESLITISVESERNEARQPALDNLEVVELRSRA